MRLPRAYSKPSIGGLLLFLVLYSSGCHSTTPGSTLFSRSNSSLPPAKTASGGPAAPGQPSPTAQVRPGMELAWEIQTLKDEPGLVRSGRAVVGPDGTLILGPYGACLLTGQTLAQARVSVEKHLGAWVKNPTVRLSTVLPEPASREIAWRSATPAAQPAVNVASMAQPAHPIRPTAFQGGIPGGPLLSPEDAAPTLPMPQTMPMPQTIPGAPMAPMMPPGATLGMGAPMVTAYPQHGPLKAPSELNRVVLPPYVIGVSDVLMINSLVKLETQPVFGSHLVRPDGTVGVGIYGSPLIAGLTILQAKEAIAHVIFTRMETDREAAKARADQERPEENKDKKAEPEKKNGALGEAQKLQGEPELKKQFVKLTFKDVYDNLDVDVIAYNSKVYYVITDGGGYGEQVYPFPMTGNETVLDALGKIYGLPWNASKKHIWVARRVPGNTHQDKILPVDWIGITQHGATATNYQIMPGDRVYVKADGWRRADAIIAKILSPIERILGVTLLGSQTVNSIRSGTVGGGVR
jgi:polysaccharide export outer membrane protein